MPNEILTLLGQIFEVCIIPLLGILVPFVIKWIRTKTATLAENANNETAKKYIGMLTDTVTNAVIAVNQTYVDALKGKNAFTAEAQQEAFTMAYTAVLNNLTDEAKIYLNEIYSDLESYIKVLIEAKVRENK